MLKNLIQDKRLNIRRHPPLVDVSVIDRYSIAPGRPIDLSEEGHRLEVVVACDYYSNMAQMDLKRERAMDRLHYALYDDLIHDVHLLRSMSQTDEAQEILSLMLSKMSNRA